LRDGLQMEGWSYHQQLPSDWMYKQYSHKIEGVDTDILYLLGPNGIIYRSKVKIKKEVEELQLSTEDLQIILQFKPEGFDAPKILENPDEEWIFNPDLMPEGWRMKKYSYNSTVFNRVEEVFHYLTPSREILRGKKAVYEWMLENDVFDKDDFQKFHFSKKLTSVPKKFSDKKDDDLSAWENCEDEDFPEGWMSKTLSGSNSGKLHYLSPDNIIFKTKKKATKYLESPNKSDMTENNNTLSNAYDGKSKTKWGEWREDIIPSLPGWQFSIGYFGKRQVLRYKEVDTGKIFNSRGSLIRYLKGLGTIHESRIYTLKVLLKNNPNKDYASLLRNDKFIKNFYADQNYLEFLRIRYNNHSDIPEVIDPKLPFGWRKKTINNVEYFRDPIGANVFNSRRLLVVHLRETGCDLSVETVKDILDESEDESELSESEDDSDIADC